MFYKKKKIKKKKKKTKPAIFKSIAIALLCSFCQSEWKMLSKSTVLFFHSWFAVRLFGHYLAATYNWNACLPSYLNIDFVMLLNIPYRSSLIDCAICLFFCLQTPKIIIFWPVTDKQWSLFWFWTSILHF